jgi:hypothetical protein
MRRRILERQNLSGYVWSRTVQGNAAHLQSGQEETELAHQLRTNREGKVITNPVIEWNALPIAEISVLLTIKFFNCQKALQRNESKSIQLLLTPDQCLTLAADLVRGAKSILEDPLPPGARLQ